MNWGVRGTTRTLRFSEIEPLRVLYEFDGPRTFTIRDEDGDLWLLHWCDEEDDIARYVASVTNDAIVAQLLHGEISVRDALNQPRVRVLDVKQSTGLVTAAYNIKGLSALPNDALPAIGTMLLPELEPILTLRATGERLVAGSIPGSVVANVINAAQKSLKHLAEYVLAKKTNQGGRPATAVRRLYDLPTRRLAFGSLEVAFGPPTDDGQGYIDSSDPNSATLSMMGDLLDKGLNWASSNSLHIPTEDVEQSRAILVAVNYLSPPASGRITEIEIAGALFRRQERRYRLTRDTRKTVSYALAQLPSDDQEKRAWPAGRVRELDLDKSTFELRNIEGEEPRSKRFTFDSELLDEVMDALSSNSGVIVVPADGRDHAVALIPFS